jgi:hypothetical protein
MVVVLGSTSPFNNGFQGVIGGMHVVQSLEYSNCQLLIRCEHKGMVLWRGGKAKCDRVPRQYQICLHPKMKSLWYCFVHNCFGGLNLCLRVHFVAIHVGKLKSDQSVSTLFS